MEFIFWKNKNCAVAVNFPLFPVENHLFGTWGKPRKTLSLQQLGWQMACGLARSPQWHRGPGLTGLPGATEDAAWYPRPRLHPGSPHADRAGSPDPLSPCALVRITSGVPCHLKRPQNILAIILSGLLATVTSWARWNIRALIM